MAKAVKKSPRKTKKISHYKSNQDVPATVGRLNEFRAEMNSKFASIELRFKSTELRLKSQDKKNESEINRLESKIDKMGSRIEQVDAAIHRVAALVEEQNAKNNAMFDQMKLVLDVVNRHDEETRVLKRNSFIPEV